MESTQPQFQLSRSIAYAPAPPLGGHGERNGGNRHQPNKYPASNLAEYYCTIGNVSVPTIFSRERTFIYGSNTKKTYDDCGTVHSRIVCPSDHGHTDIYKHISCNDPLCPTCFVKFVHRLADRVSERVTGFESVYDIPKEKYEVQIFHLVLSPPPGTWYKNQKEAYADATRIFLTQGGAAAVLCYHPYRFREGITHKLRYCQDEWIRKNGIKGIPGFWKLARQDVLKLGGLGEYLVYSPHFHGLASGHLTTNKEWVEEDPDKEPGKKTYYQHGKFFCQTGGWIYKKVKRDEGNDAVDKGEKEIESPVYDLDEEDRSAVLHYLLTHACWEQGKHSVVYVGGLSYSKLARKDKKVEQVLRKCPKCGRPLVEHLVNQVTGELGDCTGQEVMERVETWIYYKRVPKERKPRNQTPGTGQKDGT